MMASIVLRNFGGMAPSANAKSLPEAAATYVQNLDLRFGDFRPLASPANIGTATAGGTLYKMEGASTFITRPGTVNFVRGPIPNDPTERTYYSGDGAPKVTDLTGVVRQLGVPQPASAPAVAVLAGAQFSEDDARAARVQKWSEVIDAVRFNMADAMFGIPDVMLTTGAFVGKFNIGGGDPYAARFAIPGSLGENGSFTPTNPAHANLNDYRAGFEYGATPGVFYASITVRAVGKAIVDNSMENALRAIAAPNSAQPLMTTDMVTNVMGIVRAGLAEGDKNRDDCNTRMLANLATFVKVADFGDAGSTTARGEVQTFYARADINSVVEAAITRAVSATYAAMRGYTGGDGTALPVTGTP